MLLTRLRCKPNAVLVLGLGSVRVSQGQGSEAKDSQGPHCLTLVTHTSVTGTQRCSCYTRNAGASIVDNEGQLTLQGISLRKKQR